MARFYDSPTDMDPMVPDDPGQKLAQLGWEVVRRAERLGAGLHPLTAAGLAGIVKVMNSYYSHLIEGHGTRPADLEAVLRGRSEGPPARRELQQQHFAHMAAQQSYMNDCLATDRLDQRLNGYSAMREAAGDWPAGTSRVLREVCLRGEIPRGEVARLIGKSPRTAQGVIGQLLAAGCLTTPSGKGPLRLGWPGEALQAWLPGLFG